MPRKKKEQTSEPQRLQKVLAHAGIASRRASEVLIREGRVSVNGRVVTELGTKVDPERDVINVDGRPLSKQSPQFVYIMLNKPRNVLSSAGDSRGRKTVTDLVDCPERVYPVGRLDFLSEGLMLLTNDGDLTKRLTHPKHQVEKEYQALVAGNPSLATLNHWRRGGIEVEGEPVGPAKVEVKKVEGETAVAALLGARGTPAFFLSGQLIVGAQPVEVFESVVEKELKKPPSSEKAKP